MSLGVLKEKIRDHINWGQEASGRLVGLSWTLTPQFNLLAPKDLFVDLREVATNVNNELEPFLKEFEKTSRKRINVIVTDHYDTSPAVRIAVERSLAETG
jgi:hypothetical protein